MLQKTHQSLLLFCITKGEIKKNEPIHGYKVFNPDWTCMDKQYSCPGIFEEDVIPRVCSEGMHFCRIAADCFNYYPFDPTFRVAEVIALGEVEENGNKCCTNKLEIVREVSWSELLTIVNTGKNCSGLGNTGDWNTANFSNGCFNTVEQKICLFNKPSEWTYRDWLDSYARFILNHIPSDSLTYIRFGNMTDKEKEDHPEAEITGGYLKTVDGAAERQSWWDNLSETDKAVIKFIPNFDPDIFKEITGIDVNKG